MTGTTVTKAQPRQSASVEMVAAMLWGFRLESALLAVAGGAYAALLLAAHASRLTAGVIVLVAVTGLLAVGVVRRALVRGLHAAHVRRRWRLAWMHCGLAPVSAGKVESVPAGE